MDPPLQVAYLSLTSYLDSQQEAQDRLKARPGGARAAAQQGGGAAGPSGQERAAAARKEMGEAKLGKGFGKGFAKK
jgi:hypothetical protein